MNKTHKLKTHPAAFAATRDGSKPFEIRFNDRDFRVGDILRLQEYHIETNLYTGEELTAEVSYTSVTHQVAGYIVLGLVNIARNS